jgi:2'-5' RNA ligase
MRLFVSIDLDRELTEKAAGIEERIRATGADVKLVEPRNLHFTLKFLGEVPESQVPGIEEKIGKALEDTRPFQVSIAGFGYFGSPSYIRTLWVDVKEGQEQLLELMKKVGSALDSIRREKLKPAVHLTVGRVRSAKNKEQLLREIEALRDVKVGGMLVKEVKLKQSTLTKTGPVYRDVKVFTLSG